MRSLLIAALILALFIPAAYAETSITLPDGQVIPLDGLSAQEKEKMMALATKVSEAQNKAKNIVTNTLKEVATNPTALNEWRLLVTGTIKDVATDLGIGVNEFLKTPAGMGVAGLVIYKIAGKEIIGDVLDIVLAIPLWLLVMSILWYLQRQYLTTKVVYGNITETEDDNGKKVITKTHPIQEPKYDWDSNDARSVFASFLYGTMLLITFVCILIVFI